MLRGANQASIGGLASAERRRVLTQRSRARGLTLTVQLCAAFLCAVGGLVLYGWFTRDSGFIRFGPTLPPMQANTALCFALSGFGLWFYLGGHRLRLFFCALLVGLIGLLTLAQIQFGVSLGIDQLLAPSLPEIKAAHPGRMSPLTAVGFFLSAFGFFVLSRARRLRHLDALLGMAGSVIIALGVGVLTVYALRLDMTRSLGNELNQMALHSAAAFGVLGLGLLAAAWRECSADDFGLPRWLPITITVGILTVSSILYLGLGSNHLVLVEHETRRHLDAARAAINAALSDGVQNLERLARRWESRPDAELEWERDAAPTADPAQGFQAMGRADTTLRIRQLLPLREFEHLTNVDLALKEVNRTAAATSRKQHTTVFTPMQELPQGGDGFLVLVPLFRRDEFLGHVVGFFRPMPLFSSALSALSEPGYSLAIAEGEKEMFSFNPGGGDLVWEHARINELEVPGVKWRLRLGPTSNTVQSYSDKAALVIGIIVALLLGGSAHLAQTSRRQSRELVLNNQLLADEIIERRRTEQALRDSEQRLDLALKGADLGLWDWDVQGGKVVFNERFATLLGYRLDEISPTYEHWERMIHPEDLPSVRRALQDHIEGKTPFYESEFRCRTRTGVWKWLHDRGKAVERDEEGRALRVAGTHLDVSDRVQAEAAVRESETRHRAILDASVDAIITIDGCGRIETFNPAAEHIFGYPAAEIVGKSIRLLMAPPLADLPDDAIECYLAGPVREVVGTKREVMAMRRDGTLFPADLATSEIHLGGRRLLTGMIRDITERKQFESELAQARDAAVESARLKSEFLANMSHEIRTPMNGVIGMTSLLLDTELSSTQRDFAETINNSAEALLTIVNDILDFSKIEAGKLVFETIDFDLRDIVEESLEMLAQRAQIKGLELACLFENGVPTRLRGDPGRLRQVLTNLISNGIKFTERGEVVVTVRAEYDYEASGEPAAGTPETQTILFSVRDTGLGIALEAQKRLFQAFSQADGSTTRRFGGTGLGLAISRQLVELMGGRIGVESAPGHGSNFWFTARFTRQAAGGTLHVRRSVELGGTHVLIVDDNATNRRVLHHQVQAWQIRDECASGPIEALSMLRIAQEKGDPYQLVVLDLQMPDMDGFELAGKIRNEPRLHQPRLVLLTSLGSHFEPEVLRQHGISNALVKPVRQSLLFECLTSAMEMPPMSLPQNQSPAEPVRIEDKPAAHRRGTRVLVAEDNPTNLKVALFQLEQLGYAADSVGNGAEALALLQRVPYDVVLMDCQMPEMDGFEATRRIRQLEAQAGGIGWPGGRFQRRARVRIVAMTANAMQGDRDRCLAAGMDDYVSKPVRVTELQAAIERAERGLGPGPVEAVSAEVAAPQVASWNLDMPELDADVLEELREFAPSGGRDPYIDLLNVFLTDAPKRMQTLREAIQRGDADAIMRTAHLIKGSVGGMGARRLAAVFGQLEEQGRIRSLELAGATFAQAEEKFAAVCRELEQEKVTRTASTG